MKGILFFLIFVYLPITMALMIFLVSSAASAKAISLGEKSPSPGSFLEKVEKNRLYLKSQPRKIAISAKDIVLPQSRFTSIKGVIEGIIEWLLTLGSGLAVLAVVYSGIMYMTSGGDPTKTENAKKNLTWAIIGVVLIGLCLVLIKTLINVIGG